MLKNKTRVKKIPKKTIRELEQIARNLNGPGKVKAGLPKDSNDYPDGTSVIMVGAAHEFGIGVPERSWLRSTVFENRRKYKRLLEKYGKKIAKGQMKPEKALGLLGQILQDDIRNKIFELKEPPLVYREGNPLYNTGHLLESAVYQIGEGDDD